jgi:2-oxoglutarate ferredoxin oxidoreductase subunit alpha
MGPSTGLPTRTCQGDIAKAYQLSHGDCRHPLLLPANPTECYEMAAEALDLAERLQTVVFVMLDLDLGMNSWMDKPFQPLEKPIDRGKVLSDEDLAKVSAFARYKDVDGDGICYRTLPGTKNPIGTYFTRGTGHTETATYSEKPKDWKNNMDRLSRKFDTARKLVPHAVLRPAPSGKAEIGVIAFGSTDPALEEARVMLVGDHGIETDYLRLRALPIDDDVRSFITAHRVVYVVEQNRDAQCAGILRGECPAEATTIKSVLHYSGLPIDPDTIVEQIVASFPPAGGLAHERAKENGKS